MMDTTEHMVALAVALADRVVTEGCTGTYNGAQSYHDTVDHACILDQAYDLLNAVVDHRKAEAYYLSVLSELDATA
jgi:hypothetical protein